MKKPLLLLSILFILVSCNKPNDIKDFNEKLIEIVKYNSLYSDSLNWPLIEKEIDSISNLKQNVDKYTVSVNYIISKLRVVGDNHTNYSSKEYANKLTQQNCINLQPECKYLGYNIAYIKVPAFASINDSICNDFATKIQLLIKTMDSNSINGWIVDLRDNGGGNMYPMIAGLGPLTGEGVLGYFIIKKGLKRSWSYRNGIATDSLTEILIKKNGRNKSISIYSNIAGMPQVAHPYTIKTKNAKIAVLINNHTASAGEMTCISFIGKPNTKLFGEASGGYTTANTTFMLPDSSCIHLAASFTADRNMKEFHGKIIPDVIINDKFYYEDRSLNEAIKWLKSSK